MSELVRFLRARLDEDAECARMAASREKGGDSWTLEGATVRAGDGATVLRHTWVNEGTHIALHDPHRVLAEVETKRRILAEIVPAMDGMDDRIDGEWGVGAMDPSEYESVDLLRLLALPYADHPDYREKWRP